MQGIASVLATALVAVGTVLLLLGGLEYAGLRTPASRLMNTATTAKPEHQGQLQALQPWCAIASPATVVATGGAAPAAQHMAFPVTPFPANFWFVKTVKTGSSTLTSVFHSICSHYGIQWLQTDLVRSAVGVGKPKSVALANTMQQLANVTDNEYLAITSHMFFNQKVADVLQPKMLFTTVRHPLGRVYSHFVQDACVEAAVQRGWNNKLPVKIVQEVGPNACDVDPEFLAAALQNDTLESRWAFARSKSGRNHVYNYIRGDKSSVQDAASQYSFIFTAERMNEALVIFMLKYGLMFEDIAYLPLKVRKGHYRTASDMPQELNDFILENNQRDLELWGIANSRLDQERVMLQQQCGQGVVDSTLAAFEQLLAEVHAECAGYIEWYQRHSFGPPYTYTGVANVAWDSGNGYRCVRHVARRFALAGPIAAASSTGKGADSSSVLHTQTKKAATTNAVYHKRALKQLTGSQVAV